MAHEKYGGITIVVIRRVRANKFDVAPEEAAPPKVLTGHVAEVLNDLDADGALCAHPTCRKRGSTHARTEVDEYVVLSQVNHLKKTEDFAIRRRSIMHLPVRIARLAGAGMEAESSYAEAPVPELIVRISQTGLVASTLKTIEYGEHGELHAESSEGTENNCSFCVGAALLSRK